MKNSNILFISIEKDYLNDFIAFMEKNFSSIKIHVLSLYNLFLKGKFYGKPRIISSLFFNFFYLSIRLVFFKKIKYDFLLFNNAGICIPFLFLCKIFPFIKPKKNIVIINFYIHQIGNKKITKYILHFLLSDRKVTLVVQSLFEKKYFSKIANRCKIIYFPYCQEEIRLRDDHIKDQNYVFAGGYTNRDYDCLLRAAKKMSHNFIIICSKFNRITVDSTSNIEILKDVDTETFFRYLKNSKVVVIPLKKEAGSSGQMVALAAMFFKKAIIYSDVGCLSEYFEEGVTGISYKTGNSSDLRKKLFFLLSNNEKRKELGENAYKKYYENYYILNYYKFLSELFF